VVPGLQVVEASLKGLAAEHGTSSDETLQHWQKDPDLSSVRDPGAFPELPEAERAVWQQLWNAVETLLQKAEAEP
jgi:hypothetical protein